MIARSEIAGAVTAVVTKHQVLHVETTGFADVVSKRPMSFDTLFWIASMTKPVTGVAILIVQDEGKLTVTDPVAKYLPEFGNLRTPSGRPADLSISQILTHTSGLGEARGHPCERRPLFKTIQTCTAPSEIMYRRHAHCISRSAAGFCGEKRSERPAVSDSATTRSFR